LSNEQQTERLAENVITSDNIQQFVLDRMNGTQPAEEVKPVEVKEVKETEVEKEAREEREEIESKNTPEHKEKVKNSYIKLREQRNEAREKTARLEAEIQKLKADKHGEAKADTEPARPDAATYTDAIKYAEDLAEWSVKNAMRKRDSELAQQQEEKRIQLMREDWNNKVAEAKKELPDYDDVVVNSEKAKSLVIDNKNIINEILESEHGPKIVYMLASREDLVYKLNKMSEREAFKYLGRLEEQIDAESVGKEKGEEVKASNVSSAPAPITPIKVATGEKVVDEKNLSMPEYKRLRRSGKI